MFQIKIICGIRLVSLVNVAAAQVNPCLIPGYPGCSVEDFYSALENEKARTLIERNLQEQRRRNQLLEEQNRLLRENFNFLPIYPRLDYQEFYREWNRQRCMTMPLRTPGC